MVILLLLAGSRVSVALFCSLGRNCSIEQQLAEARFHRLEVSPTFLCRTFPDLPTHPHFAGAPAIERIHPFNAITRNRRKAQAWNITYLAVADPAYFRFIKTGQLWARARNCLVLMSLKYAWIRHCKLARSNPNRDLKLQT